MVEPLALELIEAIVSGDFNTATEIVENVLDNVVDDIIDEYADSYHPFQCSDDLEEARVRRKVIRNKRLVTKFKCTGKDQELRGGKCVRVDSKRRLTKRKAKRMELRTKRRKGASLKRKANIKRRKSLAKRKSFGLK